VVSSANIKIQKTGAGGVAKSQVVARF